MTTRSTATASSTRSQSSAKRLAARRRINTMKGAHGAYCALAPLAGYTVLSALLVCGTAALFAFSATVAMDMRVPYPPALSASADGAGHQTSRIVHWVFWHAVHDADGAECDKALGVIDAAVDGDSAPGGAGNGTGAPNATQPADGQGDGGGGAARRAAVFRSARHTAAALAIALQFSRSNRLPLLLPLLAAGAGADPDTNAPDSDDMAAPAAGSGGGTFVVGATTRAEAQPEARPQTGEPRRGTWRPPTRGAYGYIPLPADEDLRMFTNPERDDTTGNDDPDADGGEDTPPSRTEEEIWGPPVEVQRADAAGGTSTGGQGTQGNSGGGGSGTTAGRRSVCDDEVAGFGYGNAPERQVHMHRMRLGMSWCAGNCALAGSEQGVPTAEAEPCCAVPTGYCADHRDKESSDRPSRCVQGAVNASSMRCDYAHRGNAAAHVLHRGRLLVHQEPAHTGAMLPPYINPDGCWAALANRLFIWALGAASALLVYWLLNGSVRRGE